MGAAVTAVNQWRARRLADTLTVLNPGSSMSVMLRATSYRYYYYFATPLTGRWSRTR
jgi:hypothetical protein